MGKTVLVSKFDVMTQNHQPTTMNQNANVNPNQIQDASSCRVERIAKSMTKVKIAGHSTEFVNRVLERVKGGEPSGGLDEIKNQRKKKKLLKSPNSFPPKKKKKIIITH